MSAGPKAMGHPDFPGQEQGVGKEVEHPGYKPVPTRDPRAYKGRIQPLGYHAGPEI